jgi:hypothetical protein
MMGQGDAVFVIPCNCGLLEADGNKVAIQLPASAVPQLALVRFLCSAPKKFAWRPKMSDCIK